jgi:Uma2 family endonuclease
MSAATELMTADELFLMPHDGTKRYRLIAGELRTMSPAGSQHGFVANNVALLLTAFVKSRRLGTVFAAETGFVVQRHPDTVLAPDVSFVQRDRLPAEGPPPGFFPGPPDLAVEVISPSERQNEIDEKVELWLNSGLPLLWLVHPRRRTVTVYRSLPEVTLLTESDTLDGGDVLPGFTCRVAEIFE